MAHYYEKNIVEIKNEYTDFLVNIMAPLMYEGIKSMYATAINYEKQYQKAATNNPEIENPGVLKIFQHFLKGVPNLSNNIIDAEMTRIRDNSKYADIFEALVKSVIKSNIVLLTFNASGKKCKLVNEKLHEKTDIRLFIHKCYIECAKQFYNYPELFWHEYNTIDIKKNQREIHEIIKKAIVEAIRRMLPMKEIIEEYLRNDYIADEETNDDRYLKIKDMINNDDINGYDEGGSRNILMSETDTSDDEDNLNELETNMNYLDKLIYDRPIGTDDATVNTVVNTATIPTTNVGAENAVNTVNTVNPTISTNHIAPNIDVNESNVFESKPSAVPVARSVDNTDKEYVRKLQTGEYTTEIKNVKNTKANKLMKNAIEHMSIQDTPKQQVPEKPKEDSDHIDVVKDKIQDAPQDKAIFFNTMFNR